MIPIPPNARRLLLALLLAALTISLYHGAWNGGFIWDDDDYVTRNPLLTAPDGLRKIWFSLEAPSQYFPLTYTVFRLERNLWSLHPAGYHWVNILIHVANALLVWRLLARLKIPGAFLAALLFALHPVQVESVAWITELKNVLMGCFFLLTLLAWIEFIEKEKKARWLWYATALILFALALSAKTTACTLPAALLLILWLQKKPITLARLGQVAPFVTLGVGMGLVTIWWEHFHQGTRGEMFTMGFPERLIVASHALWFYLGKLLWPAGLAFIYPQWRISPADPGAYGWLVGLGLFVLFLLFARQRLGRGVEVAALFFASTLAPVLGFIMLYTFRYTYVADHYQYLACVGPFALAAAAFSRLMAKASRPGARAGLVIFGLAILSLLGMLTWRQAGTYRDVETLWRSTIARNPDCWMASNNLGIALWRKGALDEAVAFFELSLRQHPEGTAQLNTAETHYNLGNTLLEKGEVSRALSESRTAIALEPNNSDAHVALGNALLASGDVEGSLTEYARALDLRPDNADALYNVGNAFQEKGDVASATERYKKALQLDPEIGEAHLNLGNILSRQGDEAAGIRHYEEALSISPTSVKAQNNLAWALATATQESLRDPGKALDLALRANSSLHGDDPLVLNTLAAAYAASGQYDAAVSVIDRGLQIVRDRHGEAEPLGIELERARSLYVRHSAYRKP